MVYYNIVGDRNDGNRARFTFKKKIHIIFNARIV